MAEREHADLKLLDVLLEEELGGAQRGAAAVPPRGRLRLAAAMLFGVAVVGATAWAVRAKAAREAVQPAVQPDAPVQGPAQDPKRPEVVQPKDLDELRRLLADVKKVVLVPSAQPRGVPILKDLPVLGQLFVAQTDPSWRGAAVVNLTPYVRDFEVPKARDGEIAVDFGVPDQGDPVAATVIDAPERVRQWVGAFGKCDGNVTGGAGNLVTIPISPIAPAIVLHLRLVLADGRELTGIEQNARMDGKDIVTLGGITLFTTAELKQLIADGREAVVRAARLRAGFAVNRDDLRALPATATAIQIPPFDAATLRTELARFPALERLAIVPQGISQMPTGDAIAAIAGVATLRTLVLPADALTDADVATLAALPLRELGLTGRLRGLTAAPFARLRSLESLAIDVDSNAVDLRALLAALPALKTFAFQNPDLLDDAIDAVLTTKVERLCLQAAKLDAKRLARLAQLPSLRELRLHAAGIGPDEAAALAGMKLRRLELAPVAWFQPLGQEKAVNLEALRARLPGCVIEETPVDAQGAWWRAPK
jgi:hypothetical protein